jgi:hypothetical protein
MELLLFEIPRLENIDAEHRTQRFPKHHDYPALAGIAALDQDVRSPVIPESFIPYETLGCARSDRTLRDGAFGSIPGTSCQATIVLSLRDVSFEGRFPQALHPGYDRTVPPGHSRQASAGCYCEMSASRRDNTIVAWHEVPGIASPQSAVP